MTLQEPTLQEPTLQEPTLQEPTEQKQAELPLRIRKAVVRAAKAIGLKASFTKGRRASDIILIKLRGRREYAHAITSHLIDIFPEVDVEVLKGMQQDVAYTLTIIVTQKLKAQNTVSEERRAKLRYLFARSFQLPQKPALQGFNGMLFPENF